ncbi:hypothetical protein [Novosphingobium sp. ZW T3_23]|uniref:hypothetical protein n=1 Tax=Novosphingobium sp. ZW T3_23 TaxID=3378084 RepID=UPI0038550E88
MITRFVALALLADTGTHSPEPRSVPHDADGIFQEAVTHWGNSSSNAAVVTIVDEGARMERSICVQSGDLGRAVAAEHDLKWWPGHMDHVTDRMRKQDNRRFNSDAALQILGKERNYPEREPGALRAGKERYLCVPRGMAADAACR